jgi:hypothetical protein
VNCVHYTKCGVNSLLYIFGCCRGCVAPWINIWSQHTLFTTRVIYKFTFEIFHETRHYTQAHITYGTLMDCALSLAARRSGVMLIILLASACYSDFRITTFLAPKLGLLPNLELRWSWLFPASSIKFHTRSLKSWWVYLVPHKDNSIQLFSIVRSKCGKIISWSAWRYVDWSNSC